MAEDRESPTFKNASLSRKMTMAGSTVASPHLAFGIPADGPLQSDSASSNIRISRMLKIAIALLSLLLLVADAGSTTTRIVIQREAENPSPLATWVVVNPPASGTDSKPEARGRAMALKSAMEQDTNKTVLNLFGAFAKKFNKVYDTDIQASHAFDAFYSNLKSMVNTNLADVKYISGLNKYSDVGATEFVNTIFMKPRPAWVDTITDSTKGGAITGPTGTAALPPPSPPPPAGRRLQQARVLSQTIPTTKNYTALGKTTPVKDQGQCGSCWVFAATTTVESALLLWGASTAQSPSLSTQQVLDCANATYGYQSTGCNGGYMQASMNFAYRSGQVRSTLYPYMGVQTSCRTQYLITGPSHPRAVRANGIALTNGVQQVLPANSKAALLARVAIQPVAVYWYARLDFIQYSTGIYNPTGCVDTLTYVNHAVVVTGYNMDDPANPYWIIQNSWGTSWGELGYAKVAMVDTVNGICGMYGAAYYPKILFDTVPLDWTPSSPPPPTQGR